MTSRSAEIDAITLSILWNSLLSIADEMGTALRRTAFSEAVREGDDFSTGIFDGRGRLIAQGNFTPGHLGAMPYVIENVLKYHAPDSLKPGDSILLNDSFLGGGHFPDFFLTTPVFRDGAIIAYAVTTAHQVDMGGAAPGSQRVQGISEAYQEGLRILPIKVVRDGRFEDDLMRMILGNVRVPAKVRGDLMAQLNANHVCAERLLRMYDTYGADTMGRTIDALLTRSEEETRAILRKVPQGRFEFEDCLDDCGPGTPPIKVKVTVTVGDGEIEIDFTGSGPTVQAALNSYINYTRAYGVFATRCLTEASLPNNEGSFRPIKVKAEEGSFFNPRFPAASGGRAAVQIRIFDAVNGAFAKCIPHRAMGAFSHWANPNIGGVDPRTGKQFIMYDMLLGGYGGRATKDGVEAMSPVMNCSNIPVEVIEHTNPVRVERFELIPDSGGAGKYRGGCGIRKDMRLLADDAVLTLLGDRHKFAPYGVFGGNQAAVGRSVVFSGNEKIDLGSKEVAVLKRDDVVSLRTSGAGGYGPASERDPALIERDIADGYVTVEGARKAYGRRK
ncbi:MAG: hydantoinase B/oxoprolinase family protein [Hyphomicrobiaceae bacterium]|nr:hydantoinase B/oxoprolinase family protein [Hyphomicrobiaceae bacterium]